MTAAERALQVSPPPPPPTLWRLLSYVPPHRKHAALTVLFGVIGFALSFA